MSYTATQRQHSCGRGLYWQPPLASSTQGMAVLLCRCQVPILRTHKPLPGAALQSCCFRSTAALHSGCQVQNASSCCSAELLQGVQLSRTAGARCPSWSPNVSSCCPAELLQGGELGRRVSPHSPLGEGQAARVMRQLLSALAHLHQRRLVHGDVKPENILFETRWGGVHMYAGPEMSWCGGVGTLQLTEPLQRGHLRQSSTPPACCAWRKADSTAAAQVALKPQGGVLRTLFLLLR